MTCRFLAYSTHQLTRIPALAFVLYCSLLALYRDIEITDRHNTFYEKFTTRQQASMVAPLC